MVVMILMIPVTRFISKKLAGIQRQLMKVKDHRINTTTEALEGMKLIKLQSWEKSFLQRISGIRCDELSVLRKWVSCHRFTVDRSSGTLSSTLWEAIPLLTAIATFAAYVLSGHELKSSTAFTAIALFVLPSPPDP